MSPIITLLTDFGDADGFVGIMKGVILAIAPAVQIVDLSHQIPAQQLVPAALLLRSALPYFPPTTLHLVVIDPGVGSARRAIAIETDRGILIGPDNGVLAPAAQSGTLVRIHAIENAAILPAARSNTFHGRDVFAPAAAQLAAGIAIDQLGPRLSAHTPLALPQPHQDTDGIRGEVVYIDRFGNLITNIAASNLASFRQPGDSVSIAAMSVAGPMPSYSAVAVGEPLAIINSWDVLEIAVRNGNAAVHFGLTIGTPVTVRRRASTNE